MRTAVSVPAGMAEKTLDAHVRVICRDLGLLVYHTFDSRRSTAGFPDLVVVGPGGVLFRELKTQKGRLTPAQVMWGDALRAAGVNWGVWRPADLVSGRVAQELAAVRKWTVKNEQRRA